MTLLSLHLLNATPRPRVEQDAGRFFEGTAIGLALTTLFWASLGALMIFG